MGLLPCGLVLKKTRLVARLTFELVVELAQAVLLLPELRPATIQQRQTWGPDIFTPQNPR